MIEEVKGKEAEEKRPSIIIDWDEQAQGVHFNFDNKQLRSWDMVINVLETCLRNAKDQRQIAVAMNMQKQQQEMMAAKAIRRNIGL